MGFAPVSLACRIVAALIVGLAVAANSTHADAAADFYAGKTITMIVGPAPGGNYDLAARLVGRYLRFKTISETR
jgi:tripartite-type tricarboxylate transporter receptor subunit TctC